MAVKKKKKLVIVESPSKAKTIEKYLGSNFKVVASLGHVRDLPKSRLGVDIENDFSPEYKNIHGKGKLINQLKKDVENSSEVYLASDPDREGEAIAWHLQNVLGLDDKENRVVFNEITKNSVVKAFDKPRKINMDLVDAQQARRILDRLVGYSLSPILWKKIKRGLSSGRVQSVALGLIIARDNEINAFNPDEFWEIDAQFKFKRKKIKSSFYGLEGKKKELKNKKDVENVLKKINDTENFIVTDINSKVKKRNPSLPFTTSTLQQTSNNLLNFKTRKTMMVAQQLYEGINVGNGVTGLITYMRTDSTRISSIAQEQATNLIEKKWGKEYSQHNQRKVKGKEKIQDAHEAIRPTDANNEPEKIKEFLTPDQFKLYSLIWSRFMASQMTPQLQNTTRLTFSQNGVDFSSNGHSIKFEGFLKAFPSSKEKDNILPEFKIGDKLLFDEISPSQHFTQPPARYTEATLVKSMEENGIGRPSTYAPTIDTIQKRGYVITDGKRFVPTELGNLVQKVINNNFPDISNLSFTADLETKLDDIETGKNEWVPTLKEFYNPFSKEISKAEKELEKIIVHDELAGENCDVCGSPMLVRLGKYGKFKACSRFPDCRNIKAILNKIGIICPKCGKGEVVQRKTKKNRIFYGCSRYPECTFMSWTKPKESITQ